MLRPDGNNSVPTGSKRSHDYNVDDFFTDMKKRRVNPSYDPRRYYLVSCKVLSHSIFYLGMAERLNSLAYAQHNGNTNGNHNSANFNPRSVSLDIRTPEELAAVNEFLVTLGRDVSGGGARHQQSQPPQQQQATQSHNGQQGFSPETYFDAVSLGQLGLAGMPGIPGPGSNFSSDSGYPSNTSPAFTNNNNNGNHYNLSRSNHPSVQPNHYSMYTNMNDSPVNYPSNNNEYGSQRRHSGKYAPASNNNFSNHHYHHPTPPLESSSPHSTVSTPVNTTPPQVPLSMPDTANFDYLHVSRGGPPVPHLARPDFMPKSMRTIVPLKTAPGTQQPRAEPMEPKLTAPIHRGPPAKLTPSSISSPSKSHSLYPLLTDGDVQFKLPPMQHLYRSPSPPSRESTPSSVSTASSPHTPTPMLPSLRSIASGTCSPDSDDLSKEIGRIELESRTREIGAEDRKRHADLILNLIVSINAKFKTEHPSFQA